MPELDVAVPFYGNAPTLEVVSEIRASLGFARRRSVAGLGMPRASTRMLRPYGWCLIVALCACAREHSAKQGISPHLEVDAGAASERVDTGATIADAALDPSFECAHVVLATAGSCEIELPEERWAARLDCMAAIEFGETKLKCETPDGWWVTEHELLTLRGSACDLVRANPATLLEIFIPCPAVIE